MSENQFQAIIKTWESLSLCLQSHVSRFINSYALQPHDQLRPQLLTNPTLPLFSISAIYPQLQPKREYESHETQERNSKHPISLLKGHTTGPVTKEELGRVTWTLLHTIAAQFPDHPTKQQKRDVKELMAILSRLYPCKECADHFKEVLKANPVQAGSQSEFSRWLCHVHNVVNRSLGKLIFPCSRVDARWGKLDCINRACDLEGTTTITTNFGK